MTAKDRPEIQRYELGVHCGMYCMGGMATLTKTDYPSDDDVVKVADHLRAVKLAQIEVCDDMQVALFNHYGGPLCSFETEWLAIRAEALRKELEG